MKPFNIEPPSETKIEAVPKSITPEIDESVEFSDCLNATTMFPYLSSHAAPIQTL